MYRRMFFLVLLDASRCPWVPTALPTKQMVPGGDRLGGDTGLGWEHIKIVHEAPEDYTKPKNNIQSPDRLYKAPERLHKAPKRLYKALEDYTRPRILNKSSNTY